MNYIDATALFGLMAVLAAVPSTSVLLVVARSATYGFLNGASAVLGIVVADIVFVVLAVAGLSVIAEALGDVFSIVKFLGGIYLIWFGVRILRTRTGHFKERPGNSSLLASFFSGLFITLGDIKAILFYASVFPMFVDIGMIGSTDIVLIILITALTVSCAKLFYAWGACKSVLFVDAKRSGNAVNTATGHLVVGAGVLVIANVLYNTLEQPFAKWHRWVDS